MSGYLFAHFTGEHKDGEQIYFSVSRDGLHWKDLNGGKPVLYSGIGTRGVRDPFLVRDPGKKKFYLIATDLRIESGCGWEKAQYEGSRDLIVWESEDLVNWSEERACTVGIPEAGCVWAPEAVYDSGKEEFLVFWASMVKAPADEEAKQRIYASWTKDFRQFSEPFVYMEREQHVIDSTIVENQGRYYRFTKDETNKCIILEESESLTGTFRQIPSETLSGLLGVEGPECYLLPDGNTWCLIVDQFAEEKGYLPVFTKDLGSGVLEIAQEGSYDLGTTKKRHGGVLVLEDEEYERLERYFDREYPVIEGLYADPDLISVNGTWYLYPTTDGFKDWSGSKFSVFSSDDGKKFTCAAQVLDFAQGQVPWAVGSAWSPCVAQKNGKFYFYFCGKREDGISCIGAAVADHPEGPFTAMPEPMLTIEMVRELGVEMSQVIDPSVYEEDGQYYLLFGNGEAAVVKLAEDMVHILPETMKHLEGLYDFREAVTVLKRNGLYHFTWSCDDTGSENYHVNYGTSDNLYGPVSFEKVILEKDKRKGVLGTGHHSICKVPDRNEYVIAYHRFGTPLEQYPEGKGWHREICTAPLEFDADGKMRKVIV